MGAKVLITGATGFVGSHLVDLALARGDVEVHATRRWSSRMSLLDHVPDVERRVRFHTCDLTDPFSVHDVVARVRPDVVFHLGAQSFVSPSWEQPDVYFRTNALGTLYLLEALRRLDLAATRVLLPGSGEEYGAVPEAELPITPATILRPVNPYAVSKVAQDLLGYEHHVSYGLHVVRVRAFNHEGPRRDRVFALPSFAWQIARIEAGRAAPVVEVGHLDALRNWTDVRDMVRAYWLAVERCPPGELYLVGSDALATVRQCLERLLALSPDRDRIRVEERPELVRRTEVPRLVADVEPFRRATGWAPRIPLDETLKDTLAYWRGRVGAEP
ncbi:MAG: GDP-mannose 4,6-dehydratase [Myxococcales bacterium]|nr:GDP-mannose 4,6-dehydratase [Myxococcales bacterium]